MIAIGQKTRIIFLTVLAALLLGYKINKPFIGHHDWNGVFFGNVARNTANFGFLKTKFGAVNSFLPQKESDFKFYTHYPPIFHLLLGLEAKVFGVYEWTMRLLAVFLSLIALFLFFKTTGLLFDQKIAFVASLFFIFNPMFLYFGKMPIHEVFGLTFVAFSIYRYIVFFKKETRKNFFWLILSLILGCQTVWSAYYLAPLFIIHYCVFSKKKTKNTFFIILIPLFSFLIHLLHSFLLKGAFSNDLFSTMFFRMQIGKKAARFPFTLPEYIKKETLWLTVFFTRILCFLNLIFYYLFIKKKAIKRKINYKDGFLLIILIFPFIDVVIFRNVCFIHDYKLYYFLLSIPLLAAISLFWLKEKFQFLWKKNNLIAILIFSLIFVLFVRERIQFTKALLETSMNKPAYNLGQILKQKTKAGDKVLVGSNSFAEFLDLFLNFYGQREIIYFEPGLKDFQKNTSPKNKLVVFIDTREKPSQELLDFLEKNYSSFKTKDFLFFDLKQR